MDGSNTSTLPFCSFPTCTLCRYESSTTATAGADEADRILREQQCEALRKRVPIRSYPRAARAKPLGSVETCTDSTIPSGQRIPVEVRSPTSRCCAFEGFGAVKRRSRRLKDHTADDTSTAKMTLGKRRVDTARVDSARVFCNPVSQNKAATTQTQSKRKQRVAPNRKIRTSHADSSLPRRPTNLSASRRVRLGIPEHRSHLTACEIPDGERSREETGTSRHLLCFICFPVCVLHSTLLSLLPCALMYQLLRSKLMRMGSANSGSRRLFETLAAACGA